LPFIPTPNVALCELNYDWEGQRVNNTLWFENQGVEFDITTLGTLANALSEYWIDHMMLQLANQITYRGCIAYAQFSESAPAVASAGVAVDGVVADSCNPNNVSWAVKFNTAARGKSGRGRNYVPGIPKAAIDANSIDPAFASDILLVYNGILTEPTLADFAWVVVSHFTAGAPRTEGLPQAVTGATYSDLTVDSQRRRLPGRGT